MIDYTYFFGNFWEDLNKILAKKGNPFAIDVTENRGRVRATGKYKGIDGYSIALYPAMREARIEKGYMKSLVSFSLLAYIHFAGEDNVKQEMDICNKIIGRLLSYAEPNKEEKTIASKKQEGVILFKAGDVWRGASYTDLVNKIFKTKHKSYQRCTVKLTDCGMNGIAWIVCINGQPHGQNGDLWINRFLNGGNIIEEKYVGNNCYKIQQEFIRKNWLTFCDRVVFQKDPSGCGDENKAKCVGVYTLKSYDTDKLIRIWEKRKDSIALSL